MATLTRFVRSSLQSLKKGVPAPFRTQVASFHQSTSVIDDPLGLHQDYDAQEIVFPRDKSEKGLDYKLNWSLCAKGVAPNVHAFRNLDDKGLMMRSGCPMGKSKELLATEGSAKLVEANDDAGEAVFEDVADTLSNVIDVFVQDGALGSQPGCETRVRVVTDSPELALAVKHLLVPVPLAEDSREQGNVVTVFVATGISSSSSPNLAILDRSEEGNGSDIDVAVAGAPSLADLMGLLEHTTSSNGHRLRCAAYCSPAGATSLVFSDNALAPVSAISGHTLHGAHCQIWSDAGIATLYGGAVLNAAPSRGNVALSSGGAVSPVRNTPNVVPPPSKVVFLSPRAAEGPVSDPSIAKQWVVEAGHSPESAGAFIAKLQEHGVAMHGAQTAEAAQAALA